MTDIDKVRMLAQDVPVPQTHVVLLGAGDTVVNLPEYPVREQSVIITGLQTTPAITLTPLTGRLVFNSPPGPSEITITYFSVYLTDEQIQALLDLENATPHSVRLAAADALDIMASSEAIIQKKQRILDIQTDGPAVAAALRAHAKQLREQVYSVAYESPDGWFDLLEVDCFREREPIPDAFFD